MLKQRKTKKHVLALLDFQKLFDVSGMAIGVVLSQEERLIAYFSEKLNDSKKIYSSYDKEFYLVIHALKKWRNYLMPKGFVLYTYNHALQYIMR